MDDVDLFPGMISEKPEPGMIVGPLAANILGEQFKRLRNCDRFWYENKGQTGSFTAGMAPYCQKNSIMSSCIISAQLAELRKMSLSKVMCTHIPAMAEVQPNLFQLPDDNMCVCRFVRLA